MMYDVKISSHAHVGAGLAPALAPGMKCRISITAGQRPAVGGAGGGKPTRRTGAPVGKGDRKGRPYVFAPHQGRPQGSPLPAAIRLIRM
jgi:hypothetical protein